MTEDSPLRFAGNVEGKGARGSAGAEDLRWRHCPSSSEQFLAASGRCMWPLPRLAPHETPATKGSRGCQQRAAFRRQMARRVDASIEALNPLAGFDTLDAVSSSLLDPVHQSIQRNLWESHSEAAPGGEIPRPREAFLALRSTCRPAAYAGLPTNLASYQKGRVSLPQHRLMTAPLATLLSEAESR